MTVLLALNIWDYSLFLIIACIATFAAAILFVISLFGMGGDDMDFGGDADGEMGIFSLRSIVGFVLGFGWGGVIAESLGWGRGGSIAMAVIVGLCMFAIIAVMMKAIYNLRSDGTLKYETLIDMTANVYLTIPPDGKPGGQVMVAHPNQLFYLPAVQRGDAPLPSGTQVTVKEVHAGILTVEKA